MPSNTNQTSSEFAGIPAPRADLNSLVATAKATQQCVEVLNGARGSGASKAATAADVAKLQTQITTLQAQIAALQSQS
jgi:hypothetical protein